MLVTETTGIKLLPKIIVLNPKDGPVKSPRRPAPADGGLGYFFQYSILGRERT